MSENIINEDIEAMTNFFIDIYLEMNDYWYMRKLIYKEDHQLHYFIPIVFETDARISPKRMSNISYEIAGAGRLSTDFNTFKTLMGKHGYEVNEVKRLSKNKIPKNNRLEIVEGATGNY